MKKRRKSEIEKYEKSKSEKYERVKVKVMRTHSEFCMLACTSTFSHSSFVSFPSVSLLTALGFFLTLYICTFFYTPEVLLLDLGAPLFLFLLVVHQEPAHFAKLSLSLPSI